MDGTDKRTRGRGPLAVMLLITVLLLVPTTTAAARPVTALHRTTVRHPHRICPVDWQRGPGAVRRLITCAARYYHVPGGPQKALLVAFQESDFRPGAFNSGSCAQGIYQHLCRYWPGRAAAFGFRRWSAYNARANVLVTMRMVRREGWSPWGG